MNDVRERLLRLPFEDRVWIDALLEAGAELEVISDSRAEHERISAALQTGRLRVVPVGQAWGWRRDVVVRRWERAPHSDEVSAAIEMENGSWRAVRWVHVRSELSRERASLAGWTKKGRREAAKRRGRQVLQRDAFGGEEP